MSAKRLEEGLGLAPGQLPQSLVDGKELVLVLVRCPQFPTPQLFCLPPRLTVYAPASRLEFVDVYSSWCYAVSYALSSLWLTSREAPINTRITRI